MIKDLVERPYAFSFFQAVSLLEKYYHAETKGQFVSVGHNKYVADERIRFSVSPSLAFPRSDIDFIEQFEHQGQGYTRIEVNFLGLHGSSSPLPVSYTEKLAGRDEEDNPVKLFFDFFHNRYISLIYQVWKKYHYHYQYQSGAQDPFSSRMLHLLGLSSVIQEAEAADLDRAKLLSYVNQLSTRSRSPKLISGIVAHYFNLPKVYIEEWVYRRVEIHQTQRNQLNRSNCTLGLNYHLGKSIPDLVGKFNLCIEGVDFDTYRQFLVGEESYKILVGLMRFILRDPLAWDLKIAVELDSVPKNSLGHQNSLGQTFWLGKPKQKDTQIRLIGSV